MSPWWVTTTRRSTSSRDWCSSPSAPAASTRCPKPTIGRSFFERLGLVYRDQQKYSEAMDIFKQIQALGPLQGPRAEIRGMPYFSAIAGGVSQYFNCLIQSNSITCGYIEYLAGNAFGRSFGGQQISLDHVLNKGKIAALLPISINSGSFAGKHLKRKRCQNARVLRGRILIRAENVEIAERSQSPSHKPW